MKTILWYQPEKFGVPDVICQDGVIISGYQRDKAFEYLKLASDECSKHDLPWCGKVRLSKNVEEKVFFVKGSFKGVDECGRALSFMFMSARCDNYLEALNNELKVVHQELSEETVRCIEKKKRTQIEAFVALAVIVLLVIMLMLMF